MQAPGRVVGGCVILPFPPSFFLSLPRSSPDLAANEHHWADDLFHHLCLLLLRDACAYNRVRRTKLAVIPNATATTAAHSLAPAPEPAAVRRFRKRVLQTSLPSSAPADGSGGGGGGESSGLRSKMRTKGGKAWSRKASHLTASQGRSGPALNFAGK